MKEKIFYFLKHPLISGSAVLFAGSMIGNVFHFLFNLFMSRNLSVIEYGILISLITVVSFPGYFLQSIAPTTVNFAATFIANRENDKLKGLYIKISKIMLMAGLFFAFLFIVFSNFIATFLNIQDIGSFVMLLGGLVMFGLMGSVNIAFMQAKLFFRYASFLAFLGGFLKFIFGVGIVLSGFRVGGVLVGIIMSAAVVYIFGFYRLKHILPKSTKAVNISLREIFGFGAPATFVLLGVTSFINSDIILVKHFFPPHEAGLYAGLSLIGKVIFFFSAPIGSVMFPLVVNKHALGQKLHRMLIASLGLVLIPSILLTIFYFIFPEFTIRFFLKKEEYLAISGLVGIFGIYMSMYALLHILANFYLSIKKTKVYIPILSGAILQIVLIVIYHETLLQIVLISLIITFLLVSGLLLYYLHGSKKRL